MKKKREGNKKKETEERKKRKRIDNMVSKSIFTNRRKWWCNLLCVFISLLIIGTTVSEKENVCDRHRIALETKSLKVMKDLHENKGYEIIPGNLLFLGLPFGNPSGVSENFGMNICNN